MGQSFLNHDETSQSPAPESPDLLHYTPHRKFGSLSSKETSVSSSPRSTDSSHSSLSLIPTPIQPGNVCRLREKFMDLEIKQKINTNTSTIRNEDAEKHETRIKTTTITEPDLDSRFISRPATTSPYVSINRSYRRRGRTLPLPPSSAPRSRSSLHTLGDNRGPPLITANYPRKISSFTSETPLVRHRSRARPYVPQPRSVIIRSGFLPVLQTVDVIATQPRSTPFISKSNECLTTSNNTPKSNSSASMKKPSLEEQNPIHEHDVTDHEGHTVEVLKKDEVVVLPKDLLQTSMVLKTTMRQKKKRGFTRRIGRAIGRGVIWIVQLF